MYMYSSVVESSLECGVSWVEFHLRQLSLKHVLKQLAGPKSHLIVHLINRLTLYV